MLESFTSLAAVAAITESTRLGVLVLSNPMRNPSLLAKMAATLDVISGGRLEFGIGAGNNRNNEFEAYGIPIDPPGVRVKKLDEALRLIKRLWTQDEVTFKGRYYQTKEAVCEPKPVQKPHPPITVGGRGEQLTIRTMARRADRSHFYGTPVEFKHKLDVLRKHCQEVGRDFDMIEKSWACDLNIASDDAALEGNLRRVYMNQVVGDASRGPISYEEWRKQSQNRYVSAKPDQVIERIRQYAEMGVTYVMIRFVDLPRDEGLKLFAEEVIKRF
jgi:alkanesulfonate monooxygenase SsuD/methylene tetrahydromethanopterin reductase-like flavin-dependent oxidoreductase (luciferase family)